MPLDCRALIDSYVDWLRHEIVVETIGETCELTTPFLDRHNDHLQVYATRQNGAIQLTDDGYILSDLRTSGLDLNTPKRIETLQTVLRGFGVKQSGNALVAEASERNLGQRVHSLIQAMLAVNDMFVMAQPRVQSLFWEDVQKFLDQHDVRYSPRVKLTGKSGYDHAIDFLVPQSRARPERLLQAINAPNRNSIGSYLFSLTDVRQARGGDAEAFAILNDRGHGIGGDITKALEEYDVKPFTWSHREQLAPALAS